MEKRQTNRQIFIAFLIYFVCMLAFCGVRIMTENQVIKFDNYYLQESFYTVLIQIGIMVVIPTLLFWILLGQSPKKLKSKAKIRGINLWSVVICFGIGIVAFLLNIAVSSIFNGIIRFTGYTTPVGFAPALQSGTDGNAFIFAVIFTAILPALCEEYLHRGLMLYEVRGLGIKKSILITSILFGLLHFNINQVFYTMILGILIAFVAVVSRSLYPAIIIHFTNNFLNTYLEYASYNNWFGGKFYDSLNNFLSNSSMWIVFLACFGFLILCGILLAFLIFKLFKHTTLLSLDRAIEEVYKSNNIRLDNTPVVYEANKVINELIESNSTLNTDFNYLNNPIDMVLPKDKQYEKVTWRSKIFMYASLTLGILVVLSTFIWGFL